MSTFLGDRESSPGCGFCLVLFLIAFAARCIFLVYLDEPIVFFKYPFFADKLAQSIDIQERIVDLSPFYLYFLTFLKKVFDLDWTLIKPIQSFVGGINCMLVYALGCKVFRKKVGVLAALLLALYGNVIILESTLEPTVFVLLFNILCIYFLFCLREHFSVVNKSLALAVAAGFFAGLSIITKPNFLFFLPVAAGWMLFLGDNNVRITQRLQTAALFCCVAILVVLPVTVRNYLKTDDFVLVTADAGKVFYHGNGKGATALEGTGLPNEGFMEESAREPDHAHVLYRKTAARLSGKDLTPSESSRFWIGRALGDIRSDAVAYIILEAKKLFYFFNDYEMHYIASAYKEYQASLSFPYVRYGIIASLGVLGMILSLRRFKDLFLLYGMVFVYLLSGMLFLVQSRYRTPAVPYLCLFAGYSVYAMKEMVAARRFKQTALSLVLVGILFALTRTVYRSEILNVDQWQRATKIHYQMAGVPLFKEGRYQEAISELNQCTTMAPSFAPAYNLMGKSYAMLGRFDEAVSNFEKVTDLAPQLPEGYKNLGFVYVLKGDRPQGTRLLSKALSLSPNDDRLRKEILKLKAAGNQS
ncbi:MAG: tetratricopeptide repeat protein [Desulfobacterales bacterium]|nr:MAG: tetratricopeptide repeat protein [Desulfobacterales bacterium]